MTCTDPEILKTYESFPLPSGVSVCRRRGEDATGASVSYVCPGCLAASGKESVLVREESVAAIHFVCPQCRARFLERKKPLTGLAMSPWG